MRIEIPFSTFVSVTVSVRLLHVCAVWVLAKEIIDLSYVVRYIG